ncbi:cytochrome P450 [Phlegmacium glaucopus]|nr:cytochrome P450 [Phlegmacium glaucopus]
MIYIVLALLTVVFFFFTVQSYIKSSHKRLPPGPNGIPILGNLLQVPILRPYPQFREWAQKYGSIFSLKLGPQNVIVLNTAQAANELLHERSKIYSSRAPPHVAHDILSASQRLVFLPYDTEWKTARKTLISAIGPQASKALRSVQELESRVVIWDLMNHGDKSCAPEFSDPAVVYSEVPEAHWFALIRRYTTSVVMTATYGTRVTRVTNNPHLHKIYDVLANFAHVGQPGNYLADVFPIIRKLPDVLAPWRIAVQKMHEWEMELWGGLLDGGKRMIEDRIPNTSYVNTYLRTRSDAGHPLSVPGVGLTPDGFLRDKLLAYTAGTILEAGSDTTASTMQSFVLFMLSHPPVLERVRAEIDAAVGAVDGSDGRMPEFEDEEKCPYFVACIKETLRRRPPTIMGIPHLADEDDEYQGMFIPKGSTIIGNVWAIHMDPTTYPNPRAYQPERFLIDPCKKMAWGSGPETRDRDHYVFGWGRRFCPGYHIAEASFFIVLSRLIWALDLKAPIDPATGRAKVPDINDEEATYTSGFVSVPRIFPVSFKPRSHGREEQVRRAFQEAQGAWDVQGLERDQREGVEAK